MVEFKPKTSSNKSAVIPDLNGLGERRLPLADVVRFLGNEDVGGEVIRRLVTATELMDSPDEQLPLIPRDLITLAEASTRYKIPYGTLNRWVFNKQLEVRGRERFASRGGGKILVDAEDVAELQRNRPPTGRPRNPQNGHK